MTVPLGKSSTTYKGWAFASIYWQFRKCQQFEANAHNILKIEHLPQTTNIFWSVSRLRQMLTLIIMGEHLPKGTVIFKNWSKLWQNKLVSSCRQMLAHNNRGKHLPSTTDILLKKLVFWEVFGDFGNFRPVNLPKTGNILKELLLVLGKCFPYNKHLSICIKLVSFSEICPSVNSKNVTGFRQKLFVRIWLSTEVIYQGFGPYTETSHIIISSLEIWDRRWKNWILSNFVRAKKHTKSDFFGPQMGNYE